MTPGPRFSDRVCCCCARPATGVAYAPKNAKSLAQFAWVCDDVECLQLAKGTYSCKQLEFHRLDDLAIGDGGDAGGAYLDSIGKGDMPLSSLTADEWHAFLQAIVGNYRAALKGRLRDESPF